MKEKVTAITYALMFVFFLPAISNGATGRAATVNFAPASTAETTLCMVVDTVPNIRARKEADMTMPLFGDCTKDAGLESLVIKNLKPGETYYFSGFAEDKEYNVVWVSEEVKETVPPLVPISATVVELPPLQAVTIENQTFEIKGTLIFTPAEIPPAPDVVQ